jgi:hypothetical protein
MFYAKLNQNSSAFSIIIDTEEVDFMSAENKLPYARST